MRVRGIVFDLDGTLVDSAPSVASVLNGMRAEHGFAPVPDSRYRGWISLGAPTLVRNALDMHTGDCTMELAEFRRRLARHRVPASSLYAGVPEVLERLARRGMALAICSNKPESLCVKLLEDTGIAGYFGAVIGGDTMSASKPSREPILAALAGMGTEPDDAIFVGDSTVDQKGSAAAGVRFVFFAGGYDDGVRRADCFLTIGEISDLDRIAGG
ncbi:HAD-IA family hydrolase [Xanthobacter sp. VTT E-85241]|uniref:HAD-IA family hydrolase n=1 Tax=Roseixanthobacter finlandensis TaxID=3119922 RepID=UPI003729D447